jgi:hypothetical protein
MADFRNKNGKIILSSSKDADVYDSAVIWVYDYFVVRSNSEVNKKIFLDYNLRYNNNDYIERIDNGVEDIYIDGEPSEWKRIPAGAVIRVIRSADGSYTQIYAKKKSSVAGTVTQKEDGIYTIDDTAQYKITKNLESYIDYCVITDDETILPLDKKIFEIQLKLYEILGH